ncbi:prepilin-type N-terminal cleavage/methylation domain-containing protein [Pseudomonas sp. 15FMM2]|uniref:Prepilin-type N-terminal cleavage/methylation domain-containing protein n=1 Tax=Pseudomonas imrae TaxID=2992837 RepID=A0ACC7PEA0_9PSED
MTRPNEGFGLLELLLALALGLVVVLAAIQVSLATRSTYVSQYASELLQDDARFILSKMTQEIRLAGMFGCLSLPSITDAPVDFSRPVGWFAGGGSTGLILVTADVGAQGSRPDWTVLSDCVESAQAYAGSPRPGSGQISFPLRRLTYTYESGQLKLSTLATPAKAVLVDNVRAFELSFGMAGASGSTVVTRYDSQPADESLIRSVRIVLTLQDPGGRVRDQTYSVVAALRNRLD